MSLHFLHTYIQHIYTFYSIVYVHSERINHMDGLILDSINLARPVNVIGMFIYIHRSIVTNNTHLAQQYCLLCNKITEIIKYYPSITPETIDIHIFSIRCVGITIGQSFANVCAYLFIIVYLAHKIFSLSL